MKDSKMKKIYQKPEVEIFEFEVEEGFALSYDPSSGITGCTEQYGTGSSLSWGDGSSSSNDEGNTIGTNDNGLGNNLSWDF